MKIWTVVVCTVALWTGTAMAGYTPQQDCNRDRVKAWKEYVWCIESQVARDAHQQQNSPWPGLMAKCRHTYFRKWADFQRAPKLTSSSCNGNRFTDNGTTVTDNLTMLQWEKKTTDGTIHDADKIYEWSTDGVAADGPVFQTFMSGMNAPTCFAGQCDWRMPTISELQTILLDYACPNPGTCFCPSSPCVDPIFGSTPSANASYWSGTPNVWVYAWYVVFKGGGGLVGDEGPTYLPNYVRAVRGGL